MQRPFSVPSATTGTPPLNPLLSVSRLQPNCSSLCVHCFSFTFPIPQPPNRDPTQYPVTVEDVALEDGTLEGFDAVVHAAFNCNPADDSAQQTLQLAVNDRLVADPAPAPNSGRCFCPNCGGRVAFAVPRDAAATAFNRGAPNTFRLRASSSAAPAAGAQLCLSRLALAVHYSAQEPVVLAVTPAAGPARGGTNVSLQGLSFTPTRAMRCRFTPLEGSGSFVETPVTVLERAGDIDQAYCVAPALPAGAAKLEVRTEMLPGVWAESPVSDDYRAYADPVVRSYRPHAGPAAGGTAIVFSGTFARTPSPACMFASKTRSWSVEAVFDDNGNGNNNGNGNSSTLRCTTPEWKEPEQVVVHVSLNGQQYVEAGAYAFEAGGAAWGALAWVLAGVGAAAALAGAGAAAVWCRHRHTLDGYERIREGNVLVTMKELTLGERIGRGTFGEVYRATWRGAVVAVKKLAAQTISEDFVREFEKEVSLMRSLRSPNVLQFLGSAFQPPNNICIVMEYMSRGSLYSILHNYTTVLDWELVLRMVADTARGMLYLHTCRPPVIHRDLKSHNLLVDEFWRVKVCDFGLSTVLEHQSQTMTACGTPCWTAPEVLKHLHYTVMADVYSFAIVLWECAARTDPYQGMAPFKVIYAVGREKMRPRIPPGLPPEYVALMRACWDDNPDARPDFAAILDTVTNMAQLGWSGQPAPHIPLTSAALAASVASPTASPTASSATSATSPTHVSTNVVVEPTATVTTTTTSTETTQTARALSSTRRGVVTEVRENKPLLSLSADVDDPSPMPTE